MKKKLLKSPEKHGDIFFSPDFKEIGSLLKDNHIIGTSHQPYFFNPGVSLKFLFAEKFLQSKKIIFLDTDKVKLNIKLPSAEGRAVSFDFLNKENVLLDYPMPPEGFFYNFFDALEARLKQVKTETFSDIFSNFLNFKEIVFKNINKKFLKELLAESFLEFYNIEKKFFFLSDFLKEDVFEEFFLKIYKDSTSFIEVFNRALEDYRQQFRFRYKNFPFPRLGEEELPFWILKGGLRERCFKKDLDILDYRNKKIIILPRASTLTIFLRLYKLDLFIHGIGGANYEWVQDQIIERFFKKTPFPYLIVSGTFLIGGIKEREFPYFIFNPGEIRKTLNNFIDGLSIPFLFNHNF